jgi:hypothetical protein
MEAGMSTDETIQELVRRVAEFYQPERIYLFGSAARGAHVTASLPATILREGRLLYDARRTAA